MLPDYVLKYKKKGYKILEKNGYYYLYKTTSKYIKGMKNPQCVNTYVGVITEVGLLEPKVRVDEPKCYEFGISMYLDYISKIALPDYADIVRVKAILIFMYGIHIFNYHFKNSYLSIIYPKCIINGATTVDRSASQRLLQYIDNNTYSELFGITAINISNKWLLANITDENKKTLEKYKLELK